MANARNLLSRKQFNKIFSIFRLYSKNEDKSNTDINQKRAQIMARGLPKRRPITGVDKIVLISSGKGGVGKSTTAVNIAVALKALHPEKSIGLLDADIFGPSIPLMMNINESPCVTNNNLMIPLVNYGIKCMSMGFLLEKGAPVIWRGLMVMQALDKLMRQVDWGDKIDYLIVDTPPGTGDTHLSLVQNLPIAGVILVTTPQTAAVQVMKRGANMFTKLNVPIIGIIENMSSVNCPSCKKDVPLYGSDDGQCDELEKTAKELCLPVLSRFPLNRNISDGSDKGVPIVISCPNCTESNNFKLVANKIVNSFK